MNACERPATRGPNKGLARTGTAAGYAAHRRSQETPCEACAAAYSEYKRQHYAENREANREYRRRWYAENREAHLEYHRQRYAENREARLEYARQHYAENREAILEYKRRYHAENREALLEHKRQYYAENREAILEYRRRYYAENLEAHRERDRQRRAENRNPTPLDNRTHFVYTVTLLAGNMATPYYVGITHDLKKRWSDHGSLHGQTAKWFRPDTFWEVRAVCDTRQEALDLEAELVAEHFHTLVNDWAVKERERQGIPHPQYDLY